MGGIQCQEGKKQLTLSSQHQVQIIQLESTTTKQSCPCIYTISWKDTKPPRRIGKLHSPYDTNETEDICDQDESSRDQSFIKAQSMAHSENSSTTIKNILKNLNLTSPSQKFQETSTKQHKSTKKNKKISMDQLEALF